MRTLRLFGCDLRYQFKYGFFFLYALMTVIYVAIISLLPMEWRQLGAALVILTDPATLGFMFIGGILLLEKGEGLHGYLAILPVRISEYVAAKSLSLATISTLAGLLIARLSLPGAVDLPLLAVSLLVGSAVFTLAGLAVGALARSVNHYLVISLPVELMLMAPPLLIAFRITSPLLEVFPGTMLLRALAAAVGLEVPYPPAFAVLGLLPWLALTFWSAGQMLQRSLPGGSMSR